MKRPTKKLNIMRFLAFLLICSTLISLTALSASALESGAVGNNLSWVLDAGTLTITGIGEMVNYTDYELPPWYEFRDQIVRVVISDKITSIGNFAFYGCRNLTSVTLPNSVKVIGDYAFASCQRLTTVHMSGSVSSIGNGAFYSCSALESIRLPYGLSYLGSQAFYRCESLKSISIPADVRTMGDSVFAYCKKLVRAEVNARISELPAWTFYSCTQLSDVSLANTIKGIANFGFKKCDSLSNVYYPGTEKEAKVLREHIAKDVTSFEFTGYVSNDEIPPSSTSGEYVEQENDVVVQSESTVLQNPQLIMSCTIERTFNPLSSNKGTYVANIVLTVENKQNWELATEELLKTISQIHQKYSDIANPQKITVTLYLADGLQISKSFLNSLVGRDVYLSVHLSNGSNWNINCKELKVSETEDTTIKDYSYTIREASPEAQESLGTDNCYNLVFDETTTQKAEVIVQLPTGTSVNTNAFLYKVEDDGEYTKLQGTAVDNNGRAHFYISSIDEYNNYIIGLDVPHEDTSDIIIPDELMPPSAPADPIYGSSALERLENIQYVESIRNYHMGVGYGGLTWILIAVLVVTTIIVGGIMTIINKSQKAKMRMRKA